MGSNGDWETSGYNDEPAKGGQAFNSPEVYTPSEGGQASIGQRLSYRGKMDV